MNTTLILAAMLTMFVVLVLDGYWVRHCQKKMQKHDAVLFPFCQLRREIMKHLFDAVMESPATLSRGEFDALRRLSRVLDATIHNYNRHKTEMFNLRKMVKLLHQYRHTVKEMPPVDFTDNSEIREFHHRFLQLFCRAFVAYTPLIRWEMTLRFMVLVSRNKYRQYVLKVAHIVRDDVRRYGLLDGRAAAI